MNNIKYWFVLLFVSTAGILSAQKNRVGISFSPDITNRTYRPITSVVSASETPKWGFTAGANYERQLSARFWFTTGLYFTDKGFQFRQVMLTYTSPPPLPAVYAFSQKVSYYMVGLPVGASWYFRLKKTRMFINAGLNINYLLRVRDVVTYYKTDNTESKIKTSANNKGFSPIIAGAEIAFGIERDFKGLTFRFSPRLRSTVTNTFKTTFANRGAYFNSLDLNFSVLKSF